MNQYSQYFTNNIYSKLLIDNIDISEPKLVLDLGIGDGALTKAAILKWANAKVLAIDVDKEKCNSMKHFSNKIKIIQQDGLAPDLKQKIHINVDSVDVAICNPPYQQINNNETLFELFNTSSLYSCCNLKRISSDIIFLAHNLSLLRQGGYLGIILPDGILTRKDFTSLRKDLIENHTIKHIIQLPDGIFEKTEARTHIIILCKGKSHYKTIPISLADRDGKYVRQLEIPKEKLIDRMDFTFHLWKQEHPLHETAEISIDIQISRGSYSHKELRNLYSEYFHSTHFKNAIRHSFISHNYENNKIIAQKGDILMIRVGKRCAGKTTIVTRGNIIISDCIYRIRVDKKYQLLIWKHFNSPEGKKWLQIISHGVCSKVISKVDLLLYIQQLIISYTKNLR